MERFLTFGNEQVEVFDNSEEQVRFVPDDRTETVKSLMFKPSGNKKVLLRERKRHTDRSVSSTPNAVLSRGVGVPTLAGE